MRVLVLEDHPNLADAVVKTLETLVKQLRVMSVEMDSSLLARILGHRVSPRQVLTAHLETLRGKPVLERVFESWIEE